LREVVAMICATSVSPVPIATHSDMYAAFEDGTSDPARQEVHDAVDRLVEAARVEHGDLSPAQVTSFLEYVAAQVRTGDTPVLEALTTIRGGDLWLAHACGAGDGRAIKTFMVRYAADVRRALRGVRIAAMDVDDLAQEMARRMFAGDKPKIAEYSGRGDLRAWVRIVAMRLALDFVRVKKSSEHAAGDDRRLGALEAADKDAPDQAYFRRLYRKEVSEAITVAASELDVEARNALREHYVHGLSIDQIAAVHGIHRATAARRVQRARETLVSCVREILDRDHGLRGKDLASVMGLVRSQLHLSMDRVFR
jgi:RNA polymerase sigma-70 factor (ECF subfamily)